MLALAALLGRIIFALPLALNPDEAMHVIRSSEPTLWAIYREDLAGPDPSLLHFILFPLCKLNASDTVLRLPSILAGVMAALFSYLWLRELRSRAAGLIGMIIVGFAPAVLFVTSEVRAYGLLLGFSAAALWLLVAGVRRGSAGLLLLFGVAQCLALVSQYSALLLLAGAGCYSLVLVITRRIRGRQFWAWLGAEVLTLGLLVFLYVTHISKLRGGEAETSVKQGFLGGAYFDPAKERILGFVFSRTVAAFRFLFTSPGLGLLALLLLLLGVVLILWRGPRPRLATAALVLVPWLGAVAASLLGLHPYAGTRHIVLLILFATVPIALLLAWVAREKLTPILFGALLLVPVWNLVRLPWAGGWLSPLRDGYRSNLLAAVSYVRSLLPAGGVVFADLESHYVFRRYLFSGRRGVTKVGAPGFHEYEWQGYRMITLDYWYVTAESLGNELQRMAETYGLEPGTKVVAVSAGWGTSRSRRLARLGIEYPGTREYGFRVAVMPVVVGEEKLSDSRRDKVSRTRRALYNLAWRAGRSQPDRVATVVWPSYYLDSTAEELTKPLADVTISYSTFYRLVLRPDADFDRLLPALAFWVFGTKERHVKPVAWMNGCENYIAGDQTFTLLGVDPDSLAAVYLVTATP